MAGRYVVVLKIAVNAKSKMDARKKVQAMLTTHWYKGQYLDFRPTADFMKSIVEKLPF